MKNRGTKAASGASVVVAVLFALAATALPGTAAAQAALVRMDRFTPHELRMTTFSIAATQEVQIDAIGADHRFPQNSFFSNGNGNISYMFGSSDEIGWRGNAWILDAATRKVVWELRDERTERESDGVRSFKGSVRLPAGSYEAYFASYSAYRTETSSSSSTRVSARLGRENTRYYDDGLSREFEFRVTGDGRVLTDNTARIEARDEPDAFISLAGDEPGEVKRAGFRLTKPVRLQVTAQGEMDRDDEFDYGWIINADTRQRVWSADYHSADYAGGAAKNRRAQDTITLPAGNYAAVYAMDETHDPGDWNAPPPLDPRTWGMTVRIVDAGDRSAVSRFEYQSIPANAIVALTGIGDDETRSAGFTLDRPMDVRILAIGEASGDDMADYAWITDAKTRRRVWRMEYDETEHAGGASKNRAVTKVLSLDAGSYIVNYRSDGSHSFQEWNSGPPLDGELWGVTVLPANPGERSVARAYNQEAEEQLALAQIVRVGDDENERTNFRLDRAADVRVYALGEASGRSLADYGWIEDRETGRVVWEMTYRMTEAAGGATKNRMFDGMVHLPAGEYVLRYETDGSHSYRDWNDDAPDDPAHWGITVYRPTDK